MERNLTCIICPRGCALNAQINAGHVVITGHTCPEGEEYAVKECTNPVRTVTATVRVNNRKDTMASVKTAVPVSKDDMLSVMEQLRKITVAAPVSIGDVILKNVCGSDIVITKEVL